MRAARRSLPAAALRPRRRLSSATTLAVNGGEPVRTAPMPPRRLFGEEEKAAAIAVFDEAIASGEAFGYNGPHETGYEADFCEMMGGGYADGVNSGTSALFCALGALDLPPCSEVVVPAISDPGAAMPAALLNCVPVVRCALPPGRHPTPLASPGQPTRFQLRRPVVVGRSDVAPGSYNIGPEQVESVLSERTRAIVVAHLAGRPCMATPVVLSPRILVALCSTS